ncbi:unnamed protein product [Calicophoron daubneyi]|uniref:Protein kinase domain-containing protein n=1 Tax=Calicophoron daubneyi TaxID=300641 RepID=A0AAV2TID9_CALDB
MIHIGKFAYDPEHAKLLGSGTFGTVFVGHMTEFPEKEVAIKFIRKEEDVTESFILDREVSTILHLKHPNIVELYDYVVVEEGVFLIMELCNGGNLSKYIKKKIFLNENEVKYLLQQLVAAVSAMKSEGVIHRDLKPMNILLSHCPNCEKASCDLPIEEITFKIADFGFARDLPEGNMASTFCGSPTYMAPEILLRKRYDGAVDVWSLGVIAYECLNGTPPVDSQRNLKTFFKNRPDFKPSIPYGTSVYLEDLLLQMLKCNPATRISIEGIADHPFLRQANSDMETPTPQRLLRIPPKQSHQPRKYQPHRRMRTVDRQAVADCSPRSCSPCYPDESSELPEQYRSRSKEDIPAGVIPEISAVEGCTPGQASDGINAHEQNETCGKPSNVRYLPCAETLDVQGKHSELPKTDSKTSAIPISTATKTNQTSTKDEEPVPSKVAQPKAPVHVAEDTRRSPKTLIGEAPLAKSESISFQSQMKPTDAEQPIEDEDEGENAILNKNEIDQGRIRLKITLEWCAVVQEMLHAGGCNLITETYSGEYEGVCGDAKVRCTVCPYMRKCLKRIIEIVQHSSKYNAQISAEVIRERILTDLQGYCKYFEDEMLNTGIAETSERDSEAEFLLLEGALSLQQVAESDETNGMITKAMKELRKAIILAYGTLQCSVSFSNTSVTFESVRKWNEHLEELRQLASGSSLPDTVNLSAETDRDFTLSLCQPLILPNNPGNKRPKFKLRRKETNCLLL